MAQKQNPLTKFLNKIGMEQLHGGYRRTSAASKGCATNKSNQSPGGSGAQGTSYPIGTQTTSQGTGITWSGGQWSEVNADREYMRVSLQRLATAIYAQQADFVSMEDRRKTNKWAPPWMMGKLGEPNAAKIWQPHQEVFSMRSEGVQAGEIIAWRAWHWNGKRLRSVFVDYEWPIDKPAFGEPGRGYGIHAFKSKKRAIDEYRSCLGDLCIGQVALWGDVVEFEDGYTAECAKVISLDMPQKLASVTGTPLQDFDRVKRLYGVEE